MLNTFRKQVNSGAVCRQHVDKFRGHGTDRKLHPGCQEPRRKAFSSLIGQSGHLTGLTNHSRGRSEQKRPRNSQLPVPLRELSCLAGVRGRDEGIDFYNVNKYRAATWIYAIIDQVPQVMVLAARPLLR